MSIKNHKRNVNKKLIRALTAYNEMNLVSLGQKCDPPVTNAALCMLLNGRHDYPNHRLIKQVSRIFNVKPEVLFPYEKDAKKPIIMVLSNKRKHLSVWLIEQMARIFNIPAIPLEILFVSAPDKVAPVQSGEVEELKNQPAQELADK